MVLPRSAVLSLWLRACLLGSVGPDDFASETRGDDPQHLVVGWPGSNRPMQLSDLPAAVSRLPASAISLALPIPGDLLGLAGPAVFNADALDAEEAVVISGAFGGYGLVPTLDARTVLWMAQQAAAVPPADPAEASRALRQTLLEATAELARLDVAHWQPEIPDLLLNLHRRPGLNLAPGTSAEAVTTLERAVLCKEIVELARADDGGAVTGFEIEARARCLTDLERTARRAISACCSANLSAS